MLYIIGIGLKPSHLTIESLTAIKKCDRVYLENYTSMFSEGSVSDLEELTGKKIFLLNRRQVEEELESVILSGKKNDIALLVFGNALNATTHIQILIDAKEKWVKTKVIPGISIFDFLGETGLNAYKFGRTPSIVYWQENFHPESFYDIVIENKEKGLHTLCLLDIKTEENKYMSVKEGIEMLEKIDDKRGNSFVKDWKFIGIAGMGNENQEMRFGDAEYLKKYSFELFPQSLIVTGKLDDKEKEAINKLEVGVI